MRYRSRGTPGPTREVFQVIRDDQGPGTSIPGDYHPPGPKTIWDSTLERVYPSSEQMWDISSEGSGHDHPCTHVKYGYVVSSITSREQTDYTNRFTPPTSSGDINITYRHVAEGSVVQSTDLITLLPTGVMDLVDTKDVINQHISRVLVPISESVSLGNFVLELGDIKRIWDNISEWRKTTPGDQVLGHQFGVRPLFGDILAMRKALSTMQKQLEWLKRNAGKPVRIVTQRIVDVPGAGEAFSEVLGSSPYNPKFTRTYDPVQAEVKCVSWVTYPKDIVNSALVEVMSALRAFGLTNPAKIAWNAVPYSFVVDWLFNVSHLIDHLDGLGALMYPTTERESFHVRVFRTAQVTIESWQNTYLQGTVKMFNGEQVGTWTETLYERSVGIPMRGLELMDPTLREQWLSLLLIQQKAQRHQSKFGKQTYTWLKRSLR